VGVLSLLKEGGWIGGKDGDGRGVGRCVLEGMVYRVGGMGVVRSVMR
jgi:hypothetical protein